MDLLGHDLVQVGLLSQPDHRLQPGQRHEIWIIERGGHDTGGV
jgi:hypothetical protein